MKELTRIKAQLTPAEKRVRDSLKITGAAIERYELKNGTARFNYYEYQGGTLAPVMRFVPESRVQRLLKKGAIRPVVGKHGELSFVLREKP